MRWLRHFCQSAYPATCLKICTKVAPKVSFTFSVPKLIVRTPLHCRINRIGCRKFSIVALSDILFDLFFALNIVNIQSFIECAACQALVQQPRSGQGSPAYLTLLWCSYVLEGKRLPLSSMLLVHYWGKFGEGVWDHCVLQWMLQNNTPDRNWNTLTSCSHYWLHSFSARDLRKEYLSSTCWFCILIKLCT